MSYCLSFPPIRLPQDLDRQTESLRALLARLQASPGDEASPDLIVLLLRAAPIPFAAVQAGAEAREIWLPPVIRAHIGSELYIQYEREEGPDLALPFCMMGPGEMAGFRSWLDKDSYTREVVTGMKRDAAAAGMGEPRRVLIYDDFEGDGGTLYAARHLLGRAFPGAELESSIAWFRLAEVAKGPRLRLRMNDRPLASVEMFLYALLTGYREGPDGLFRLDSPEQLRLLGEQCQEHGPDPYPLLAEVYGDDGLIGFSEQVQEAFRAWGRAISVA